MGWLVLLTILTLPFVLATISRHVAARIGLLLFWVACGAYAGYIWEEAREIEQDLDTIHTYALPNTVGVHRVQIAALSQGSMKGLLHGGEGVLERSDLEKFRWTFQDKVLTTWFEPRAYDQTDPKDTVLFHADWFGPNTLEYHVEEATSGLLSRRTLLVTHDDIAKAHRWEGLMLTQFAVWVLGLWGGLWMVVQAVLELRRRRRARPGPVA